MRNNIWLLGLLGATLWVGCKPAMDFAHVEPKESTKITEEISDKKEFTAAILPYKIEMDRSMNTKISYTSVDLNKKGDNSNLGNLLADFMYQGTDAWARKNLSNSVDAAVINIGGIRSSIGIGDILVKNVFEVMPFENEVVIVKIKGKDLKGLFDYYLKSQKNNPVSHLLIETEAGKLNKALVNGKEVEDSRDYYIATSDYLALGGDYMSFFSKGDTITTGIRMRDLFMEYFKANPEIKAPTDIRLIFKGTSNE